MKLNTKTRYGLRILIQLTEAYYTNKPVVTRTEVSKYQEIPKPYLEQILISLKHAGIIKTIRGCNGGYKLNKSPESITLLNIMELFEGGTQFVDCKSGKRECKRLSSCPTTKIWAHLTNVVKKEAEGISLKGILQDSAG